jgi:O6-methylguanine-DNA--protein-cysteine methyltransferase
MAEFRFKTQVIFTVEANSEQEALQQLFNAIGEELFLEEDSFYLDPIRFNTMRAFERVGVINKLLEHKQGETIDYGRPSFDA